MIDEKQVHGDLADQNPFIRDYLASQAELFHSQKVVKKLVEGGLSASDFITVYCVIIESREVLSVNEEYRQGFQSYGCLEMNLLV